MTCTKLIHYVVIYLIVGEFSYAYISPGQGRKALKSPQQLSLKKSKNHACNAFLKATSISRANTICLSIETESSISSAEGRPSSNSGFNRDSRGGRGGGRNRGSGQFTLTLTNPKKISKVGGDERSERPPRQSDRRPRPEGGYEGRGGGRSSMGRGGGRSSGGRGEGRGRGRGPDSFSSPALQAPGAAPPIPSGFDRGGRGRVEKKKIETVYKKKETEMDGRSKAIKERGARKMSLDDDDFFGEPRRSYSRKKKSMKGKGETVIRNEDLPVVLVEDTYTVAELAEKLFVKNAELIKYLMMNMGVMATVTQSIDLDTCIAVAEAFGRTVSQDEEDDDYEDDDDDVESVAGTGIAIDEDDPASLRPRAPVVTIMGHVDHGKTSLLDAIRKAKVAASEAGGITQHIGAYQVLTNSGQKITFIDTPGHAAFSEMRARGANVTDIVILVVACDDGVKEQTADSIVCAKQAKVPIVVAYNKIDKEGADVQRVKNELMQYDLLMEEYGGDVLGAEVSAKQQIGLDDLLEKVLLQAEVLDLKANPERSAQGTVIEARIEKGLGPVGTFLVQRGTLRVGDVFLAGASWGKVRVLLDTEGNRISEAFPSSPVQVVGFNTAPMAGDTLVVVDSEATARSIAEARSSLSKGRSAVQMAGNLRSNLKAIFETGEANTGIEKKTLGIVIKSDVQGSAEALASSLAALQVSDEICAVNVKVLGASAGEVSKSDVVLASVSDALVVAFNVGANFQAQEEARARGIEIMYANVVYDILDQVEARIKEILSPTPDGEYIGKAKVKQVFSIGKVGNIAGCEVIDGKVKKGANVRVMRGPRVIFEGKMKTLKNVKVDADEMASGSECGIQVDNFEEFELDDVIECYIV